MRFRTIGTVLSSVATVSMAVALAVPAFAASQVTVTLPYNRQVFSSGPAAEPPTCKVYDSNPTADHCTPYFDLSGDALPTSKAPTGTVTVTATDGHSVSFAFPSVSGDDSLSLAVGGSQSNISVTPGNYTELDLLTAAGNGPAPLSITFKYSDGSTTTQTLSVPDWYKDTPPFAIKIGARWVPGDSTMQTGNLGIYALSVPVDSSKTLTSFSIQNTGTPAAAGSNQNTEVADILAATLEPAATTTAATSTTSSKTSSASATSTAKASTTTTTTSSTATTSTVNSTTASKSTSLPKTGGANAILLGGALAAFGAFLTFRKLRRA